jgi:hypothetical protein
MGGQAEVGPHTPQRKLIVAGLDSCWGVLAIGPSKVYGAHITPGREADEEVRTLDTALRRGGFTQAWFYYPTEGDSKIFGKIDQVLDKARIHVHATGYKVGSVPEGRQLGGSFSSGGVSVTVDGRRVAV